MPQAHKKENIRPDFPSPLLKTVAADRLSTLHGDERVLYDVNNEFFREPPFPEPWPTPLPRDGKYSDVDKYKYQGDIDTLVSNATRVRRHGLFWEVYNIDEHNVKNIAALIPDRTTFMEAHRTFGDARERDLRSCKVAAFHLGRVSWPASAYYQAFSDTLMPRAHLAIVIDYMGHGTDKPIVSVRRDHRAILLGANQLPQQPHPCSFKSNRMIVSNGADFRLVMLLMGVMCSGRFPLGIRGRLTHNEIPVLSSAAALHSHLVPPPSPP